MIYLDYNATTPLHPVVRERLIAALDDYGNPSSSHSPGRAAHRAIEQARQQLAELLGAADAAVIVFTSGGTESNNLALRGVFERGGRPAGHLVISACEHPAVSEPARYLAAQGVAVTAVPCDATGVVAAERVAAALRDDTRLVSIMHANNEIGVIQPIRQIAELCRARGVLVHTDAAQSVGKIPASVDELGVDLLTVAGHKVYAPKGVGALYVRQGTRLAPVLRGAGHERGLRPGTENTPYLVALGAAAELARQEGPASAQRLEQLRNRLAERLKAGIGDQLTVNGARADRLPNTLSVNFPGVTGSELLESIPELCASTGAACHSGDVKLSATLAAIGLSGEVARGTIRLSLGWPSTDVDVETAAGWLIEAWRK